MDILPLHIYLCRSGSTNLCLTKSSIHNFTIGYVNTITDLGAFVKPRCRYTQKSSHNYSI